MRISRTLRSLRRGDARRLLAVVAVLLALPCAAEGAGQRRGGIEIGSKGVKMTLLEFPERPGAPPRVVTTAVVNTTITAGMARTGRFSPDAIAETAAAVAEFVKRLRSEYGLGPDQIRVLGSSGLLAASNRQELVDAVARATGLAPIEFITPSREVQLTLAGIVPRDRWPDALLFDIGSGNTKGGCFLPGDQAICLSVPFGSVTFADRVAREARGQPFAEAAERLRPSLIEAPLAARARANPQLTARRLVYLSGGAAYAMATLMHPEAIFQERLELTSQDIANYLRRLRETPRVPAPDLARIADAKVREAAEKEFGKVRDNFTRENLIAGAEILAALAVALQFEGKTLIFDRDSVTAWLRAALDPTLALPPPSEVAETAGTPPTAAPVSGLGEKAATSEKDPAPGATSPGAAPSTPKEPAPPAPIRPSPQSPTATEGGTPTGCAA